KFTVASNTGYKDKKVTSWFNCNLWGRQAEVLEQYLKKGTKVFITGEFEARVYEKNDGSKGLSLDVNVSKVELLGSKQESGGDAFKDAGFSESTEDEEKIPF
ncbi:single-stranded DNA-binding protein, partial [bacterium]|nr:single-stranded DNA-binding protein [bacterium]